MKLNINIRNTFGTPRIVPLDDTGRLFTELTGTKTLTVEHARLIQQIGFALKVEHVDIGCETVSKQIERGNK